METAHRISDDSFSESVQRGQSVRGGSIAAVVHRCGELSEYGRSRERFRLIGRETESVVRLHYEDEAIAAQPGIYHCTGWDTESQTNGSRSCERIRPDCLDRSIHLKSGVGVSSNGSRQLSSEISFEIRCRSVLHNWRDRVLEPTVETEFI